MESSLYREIFADGEAKGKAEGKAEGEAKLLIRLLIARVGRIAPEVRQAIQKQAQTDPEILSIWFDEAALVDNAEGAQRVLRKISAV